MRVLKRASESSPELACFLVLASATGARRSELVALRWRDTDLADGIVRIERGVVTGPDGLVEKGTKTHAARQVALDGHTVATVRAHRERMSERAQAFRVELTEDSFVFSNVPACSEPWYPDSVSRGFKRLCAEEGLAGVRLHDLRHFVATQLLSAGVDVRTVAGRLGHRNAATTLNVYAHFLADADRSAADVIGNIIAPNTTSPHHPQRRSPTARSPTSVRPSRSAHVAGGRVRRRCGHRGDPTIERAALRAPVVDRRNVVRQPRLPSYSTLRSSAWHSGAESTTSNISTASNRTGRLPRRCNCDAVIPDLNAYEAHDRIIIGTIDDHLAAMAESWIEYHAGGMTVALVASTNDHVDAINHAVQVARIAAGQLNPDISAQIVGGECAHVGDVVATRRNDRMLITSAGEPVRNRETWTVTAIGSDGSLTVSRQQGNGAVTLPADYAHEHVRLGYAATEHGYQSDTVDQSVALVSAVTSRRGLYVAATRGRDRNLLCVVTDSTDVGEAETPSKPSWPSTAPTSPPSPNAAPLPTNNRLRRGDNRPPQGAVSSPCGSNDSSPKYATSSTSPRRQRQTVRLSGLGSQPPRPQRDTTSPMPRQRPRPLVTYSPLPRDELIRRGGSSPTRRAVSTRRAGAGDGPLATRSLPPRRAASEPSNTSNKPGNAPVQPSTGTTRRANASARHKPPSTGTTPGLGSAGRPTWSRICDDRSKRLNSGVDGLAAPRSTSSSSATPSLSSPATVAETITPSGSEHSAKRHRIGPTSPASTCHPRCDTPEPANEPGWDSTCNRGRTALDPVARDPRPRGRRTPRRSEAGEMAQPGPTDRLRRTRLAWVVPRLPSINPNPVAVRSAWRSRRPP